MSDSDCEDGEILEEEDENVSMKEATAPTSTSTSTPAPSATPDVGVLPAPPSSNARVDLKRRFESSSSNHMNDRDRDRAAKRVCAPSSTSSVRYPPRYDFDRYCEDLLLKWPRQVLSSHVALSFRSWMEMAMGSRRDKRVNVEDLQQLLLHVLDEREELSPYLELTKLKPKTPTTVVLVLLGNLHPSVVQKYRPELPFLDGCTSVPCALTRWGSGRKVETPVTELLYRFAKPPVDTKQLSVEELYYGHELTFLMTHSFGYDDEVMFHPMGTFMRKSQPKGGTWELDGDLLHLKWRTQHKKTEGEENGVDMAVTKDDAYMLDVLLAEDASMHFFSTDKVTDHVYARDVPEHLASRKGQGQRERQIRLSLVGAVAADVPRGPDGSLLIKSGARAEKEKETTSSTSEDHGDEKPLKREDFDYYILSKDELVKLGYPVDVAEEQADLMEQTDGLTRDHYVQTRARAPEEEEPYPGKVNLCALDCEMCETDIGMELTRVTAINVDNEVVYDQLVKPQSTIINYHTEFSGITEEMLQSVRHTLADVQRDLLSKHLFEDTILVGHSLPSDLHALRIVHPTICDTAVLYPHERGFPFKTSLKYLTKTFLAKDIQTKKQHGHDSAEDATAALDLLIKKIRKGPSFGIPSTTFVGGAYDTLLDNLASRNKQMTLLQCKQSASVPITLKPWQLYASGDLQHQAQSPFAHVSSILRQKQVGADNENKIVAVANAVSEVQQLTSWDKLKDGIRESINRNDAICWVEVDQDTDNASADAFLLDHDAWLEKQKSYCCDVDQLLKHIHEDVLKEDTLLMVVPQGDLSLLRYLKGLRTRSKWKDASPSEAWTEEMQAAVTDALRGTMDSCAFFIQKC